MDACGLWIVARGLMLCCVSLGESNHTGNQKVFICVPLITCVLIMEATRGYRVQTAISFFAMFQSAVFHGLLLPSDCHS